MTDERRIPESKGEGRLSTATTILLVLVGIMIPTVMGKDGLSETATLGFAGVAILALIVVLSVSNLRQARRFLSDNNEGIAMLARGEARRARDVFWHWAEAARTPNVSALARHNLGWTLIRQGELQHAVDVLTENDSKRERPLKAMTMFSTSGVDIAFAHALLGKLDEAQAWLARAEERAAGPHHPSFPGMLAFARAVVLCRTGDPATAARSLDEQWAHCESILTGSEIRPLRVLRAFAHAAADTRNAGIAESLLASSKPVYAGEYTFLGVAWPEMHAFLAAHGLS